MLAEAVEVLASIAGAAGRGAAAMNVMRQPDIVRQVVPTSASQP
jgi:hypothetical protein